MYFHEMEAGGQTPRRQQARRIDGCVEIERTAKTKEAKVISKNGARLLTHAIAKARQFLGAGVVSLFVQILRFREKPLQCGCAGDEALEDALYDSHAMRTFAGIDLGIGAVPHATKLLKFRTSHVQSSTSGPKSFDKKPLRKLSGKPRLI